MIKEDWDYILEWKYLCDVIERGKRGENVELSPAQVLERLGCIIRAWGYDIKEQLWRLENRQEATP